MTEKRQTSQDVIGLAYLDDIKGVREFKLQFQFNYSMSEMPTKS
jgi:hypothetical protein